jgi:hypothetical protein
MEADPGSETLCLLVIPNSGRWTKNTNGVIPSKKVTLIEEMFYSGMHGDGATFHILKVDRMVNH